MMNNNDQVLSFDVPECDLQRLAQLSAYNQNMLYVLLNQLTKHASVSPNVSHSQTRMLNTGVAPSARPDREVIYNKWNIPDNREEKLTQRVEELLRLIHQGCRRDDPENMMQFIDKLLDVPKPLLKQALYQSLKSLRLEKQREILANTLSTTAYRRNKLIVEVFKAPREKATPDQYVYYIAFRNPNDSSRKIVFFKHHPSAAIYVMHLIDRLKRNESKPINLRTNMDKLQRIHDILFGPGKAIQGILTNRISIQGIFRQEKNRLKDYYKDIREVVQNNVSTCDFVSPYCCDAESHLMLSPETISVDKAIIPDEWTIAP